MIKATILALCLVAGANAWNSGRNLRTSPESQGLAAFFKSIRDANLQNALNDPLADIPAARAGFSALYGGLIPATANSTQSAYYPCGTVNCVTITADGITSNLNNGVVLFLHGGGHFVGDLQMYGGIATYFSRDLRLPVVYVEYGLSPELPFPGAISQSVAAYDWLINTEGVDPANVIIMGDSAGGGMTILTLQALASHGLPQPAAAVAISPYGDLSVSGETYSALADFDPFLDQALYNPRISHVITGGTISLRSGSVSAVFGDFSGLCPLYVMVGADEMLLSDSVRIAAAARAAGVDVILNIQSQMFHAYPDFGDNFPEAKQARRRIRKFIQEKIGSKKSESSEESD